MDIIPEEEKTFYTKQLMSPFSTRVNKKIASEIKKLGLIIIEEGAKLGGPSAYQHSQIELLACLLSCSLGEK